MKKHDDNNQAPKGARPLVVIAILAVALLFIGFLTIVHFKHASKNESAQQASVENVQTAESRPTNRSTYRQIVSQPSSQPISDVAPETEAALAQFGLSGTSLVKIVVVAQARQPVILPNPLLVQKTVNVSKQQ